MRINQALFRVSLNNHIQAQSGFTPSNIGNICPLLSNNYFFCDFINVMILVKNQNISFGTSYSKSNVNSGEVFDERLSFESVNINGKYVSIMSIKFKDLYEEMNMVANNSKTNSKGLTAEDILVNKYGRDVIVDSHEDYIGIKISGNPTSFFQPHNIWGDANISVALQKYIIEVLKGLSLWEQMTEEEQQNVYSLNVVVSEFHITTNLKAESDTEMNNMVTALKQQSDNVYGSKSIKCDTICFGRKGYNQLTFYDKCKETKSKLKNSSLLEMLLPTAERLVRCEIKLGSKWISKYKVPRLNSLLNYIGFIDGNDELSSNNISQFFIKRFKQVNFGQTSINGKELERKVKVIEGAIERKHNFSKQNSKPTYCTGEYLLCFTSWLGGNNPLSMLKRSKAKRIREGLISLIGIDIKSPCIIDESNDGNSNMLQKLIVDRMSSPNEACIVESR